MTATIEIGTRVRTELYARGTGTVFAIHGEQAPATVGSIAGVVATGGRATFDIVFDQGSLSKQLPECILRGVQWQILPETVNADHIATALANAAATAAAARGEQAAAKAAFETEVEQLRSDERFKGLFQGSDTGGGKLAAANIRIQLRFQFPGTKFSVRVRHHGSIDIEWTDGPTSQQVTAITDAYVAGRFDAMEDVYRSSEAAWVKVFGGARYIFPRRNHSDGLIARAIATVFTDYAGNFTGSDITATVDNYKAGRLFTVIIPLLGDSLETAIRQAASGLEGIDAGSRLLSRKGEGAALPGSTLISEGHTP